MHLAGVSGAVDFGLNMPTRQLTRRNSFWGHACPITGVYTRVGSYGKSYKAGLDRGLALKVLALCVKSCRGRCALAVVPCSFFGFCWQGQCKNRGGLFFFQKASRETCFLSTFYRLGRTEVLHDDAVFFFEEALRQTRFCCDHSAFFNAVDFFCRVRLRCLDNRA